MKTLLEVSQAIDTLILPFCGFFQWLDFSDKGNYCYDPYEFETKEEEIEAAFTRAAVLLKIPKGSDIHISLAKKIANLTGNKYIAYDWMVKAIARILSGTTYNDLSSMVSLSTAVKRGMQAKGLSEIKSIRDIM